MKKNILLFCFLLACGAGAFAQDHVCGTSIESQLHGLERMTANRLNAANLATAGQRDVTYVKIKFHLVGSGNGAGFASESLIFDLLCTLNTAFEDQDIQFYMDLPFNYISNDALFNDAQSAAGQTQIQFNKVQTAMNIFITGNFPQPGLLGYYQGPFPTNDYIVIKKSATFGSTAPHEVGHFLSLAHPFFGWEDNAWNPNVHGNPVTSNFAPSVGFPQLIPNELVDQSNCNNAADQICDTPPDYLFAFSNGQSGCNNFTGGAMDPSGALIDPMENNMMSYFTSCSDYAFTNDQKVALNLDLMSGQRNYIRADDAPSTAAITGSPSLMEPIDGETTAGYNLVAFDWTPVDNADAYLLEISTAPTFLNNPQRYIVNGTYKIVEGTFVANATYYWRVRPFNKYITCGTSYTERESFVTGTSVSVAEIDAVSGWNVSPNPVSSNESLTIQIDATADFDASVVLYNTAGQTVKTITSQVFNPGQSTLEVSTSGLNPGLYIVTMISEDGGVLNKKVVVTK